MVIKKSSNKKIEMYGVKITKEAETQELVWVIYHCLQSSTSFDAAATKISSYISLVCMYLDDDVHQNTSLDTGQERLDICALKKKDGLHISITLDIDQNNYKLLINPNGGSTFSKAHKVRNTFQMKDEFLEKYRTFLLSYRIYEDAIYGLDHFKMRSEHVTDDLQSLRSHYDSLDQERDLRIAWILCNILALKDNFNARIKKLSDCVHLLILGQEQCTDIVINIGISINIKLSLSRGVAHTVIYLPGEEKQNDRSYKCSGGITQSSTFEESQYGHQDVNGLQHFANILRDRLMEYERRKMRLSVDQIEECKKLI